MRSQDRSDPHHPRTYTLALPARPPGRGGQLFILFSWLVAAALFGWLPLSTVSAAPASQTGAPVQVSLVEFEIRMPTELPAGLTTFVVTNDGARQHNFVIEGQGIEEVFAQNLQAGESNTMTVELPPGEYRVYCPVGNHAGQGMELTLTVTEAAAAQATPTVEQAEATPAVLPTTGSDRNAMAAVMLPGVALMLLVLAAGAWAIQRRLA